MKKEPSKKPRTATSHKRLVHGARSPEQTAAFQAKLAEALAMASANVADRNPAGQRMLDTAESTPNPIPFINAQCISVTFPGGSRVETWSYLWDFLDASDVNTIAERITQQVDKVFAATA